MAKKLTTEEWIEKAKAIHSDRYDYSRVEYNGADNKVEIICKEHGPFWQVAITHTTNHGCPECAPRKQKMSLEEWIGKARAVHGSKYDYSSVVYTGNKKKVKIICLTHGEFMQTASDHTSGYGCVKCSGYTREQWVDKVTKIHGGKYTYEDVVYKGYSEKVEITCPIHGKFKQTPAIHAQGAGCQKCGRRSVKISVEDWKKKATSDHQGKYTYDKVSFDLVTEKVTVTCPEHGEFEITAGRHTGNRPQGCPFCAIENRAVKYSTQEFIDMSKVIHSNKYTYEKTEYIKTILPVIITCPTHGDFSQVPYSHLRGSGCPDCSDEAAREFNMKDLEHFLSVARSTHGDKYCYDKAVYNGMKDDIIITCPTHGDFTQKASNHANGNGCPSCSRLESKGEAELRDFLSEFVEVGKRDRKSLKGKEIDILIPEKKVAIEYNGVFWHSEKMHKNPKWHMLEKQSDCDRLGVRLIHVLESDDKVVVKKTLSHILGFDGEKYFARNCSVATCSSNEKSVSDFLRRNHLQGNAKGCAAYCLTINNSIVAVMLFSMPISERGSRKGNRYELRRFASCCRVVGGASRLLKAFLRDTPECTEIVSYSDNRWFTGNMYEKLGFKEVHETEPDYKYVKNCTILPKNKFRHKSMKTWKGFDYNPEETEVQNAHRNGWYRIWDCGKKKWELTL